MMKKIELFGHGLPSFGSENMVPVSFIMNSVPAIAFLPATVAEAMFVLNQAGESVNIEDNIFYEKIKDCTSIIFMDPAALIAINNMTSMLIKAFTTDKPVVMN